MGRKHSLVEHFGRQSDAQSFCLVARMAVMENTKTGIQNKSPTLAGSTCARATAELAAAGHVDKAQGVNVDRSLPHGWKVKI